MNPSTRAKAEEVARITLEVITRLGTCLCGPCRRDKEEALADALLTFSDSQNRELREALKPFAKCASHHWVRSLTHGPVWTLGSTIEEPHRYEQITADDLRKAAALLSQPDGKETK